MKKAKKATSTLFVSIILLAALTACSIAAATPTPPATPLPASPAHTPTPTAADQPLGGPSPTLTPTIPPPPPAPGATSPTPAPPIIQTEPEADALEAVSKALSQVRDLEYHREVQANFVSSAEITDYFISRITDEDRQRLAEIEELYQTLGLLGPSVQLYSLYLALLEEQVVGLYDLQEEELLVLSDSFPLGPAEEVTLAHELVHALQQQHFDVWNLREERVESLDAAFAMDALLEGDATFAAGLYAVTNLTFAQLMDLTTNLPETPVLDAAPPILQKTLLFPYQAGTEFVVALWQKGESWALVDQSYSRPPASTAQILHPEKYLADQAPRPVSLPPLQPLLGNDWELVLEDVLGEFMLRTYLESGLEDANAAAAATGWGGDRFTLWRNPAVQNVFVSLIEWDTADAALDFFSAYRVFAGNTGPWDTTDITPSVANWETSGRSVLLALDQDQTLLVIAPDGATARQVLSAFPRF